MQKYFTDDYDKIIKDNTIISDSLNKMNDKKKIQGCIDKLNSLEEIIDSEKEIVFNQNSQNNADSYLKKTDGLISSYSDRIQEIEKPKSKKLKRIKKRLRRRKNKKRAKIHRITTFRQLMIFQMKIIVIVKATIIMQGQVITAVIIAIATVTVQAITMAETELW